MAIVNLTPDSFYAASRQGGAPEAVVEAAAAALAAGADVVDVGAESTRPGALPVEPELEQARLLPSLAALRRALPQALLSVDTRHASTAAAALEAGADIINDVSGGADPAMLPLLAQASCGIVLMHCRGEFTTMHRLPPLADPLGEVQAGLTAIAARAAAAGIAPERLMLDPGFGFGKNLDENYPLLAGLDQLQALARPLLAGLSRKSFLRGPATVEPEARLPASLAAATAAILAGAHMIRTHDVAATAAAARVGDRLLVSIRRANADDTAAITALLAANAPAQGGTLTGSFPFERVADWIAGALPVLVAEMNGGVVGVLVASDPAAAQAAVVKAMLTAYPARRDAFIYGPVCVAAATRGRGLTGALWSELRRLLPDREAILFIRADNARSLRAHEKLGMRPVAAFRFEGTAMAVLSNRPGQQAL